MKFRTFLTLVITLLFNQLFAKEYDLVILGGLVVDGQSGSSLMANVGIVDDTISTITKKPIVGKKEINAKGLIVSSGFIDILADNSYHPKKSYQIFEKYKLTDGVTTSLQMHGGTDKARQTYDYFSQKPHLVNYGYSTKVMNIRNSVADKKERLKLIQKNLDDGALGVSHSIEYQPTAFSELVDYALVAQKNSVPLFLHLRYSSKGQELEGVREAILLAHLSRARVHIDHLNSTGGTFNMSKALMLIAQARVQGAEIDVCVYPYDFWATYVHSKRFDGEWKKRYSLDYDDLAIVGTGEKLTKKTFDSLREVGGVLVAPTKAVMPLASTFIPAIEEAFVCIASDGGIEKQPIANNHPRGAGNFATSISIMRQKGYPIETIIAKITTLPASFVPNEQMKKRGKIEVGKIADITIFDFEKVKSRATIDNPNKISEGIEFVIVGGKLALDRGKILGHYGREIKR